MHIDLFQRLEIGTCSVTALGFTRMGPRLMAFNEVGSLEHLRPKPEEKKEEPAAQPETSATAEAQPTATDSTPAQASADTASNDATEPVDPSLVGIAPASPPEHTANGNVAEPVLNASAT
jgi:hypothetical protein